MKIKLQRQQLKTMAKYIYRPELHGAWTDLLIALEETFELVEKPMKKRRPHQIRKRSVPIVANTIIDEEIPPPLPTEEVDNNRKKFVSRYHRIIVHRGTPKERTLCGSIGLDVVTTQDDKFVTCSNCLLPKYQAKLLPPEVPQFLR